MRFPTASRTSAIALLLIAAVAVAQCVLFSLSVALQRDAMHIMTISAEERAGTEVVGYDLLAAHDGHPRPDWRAEIETTLARLSAIHDEIVSGRRYLSGPVGRDGLTVLGRNAIRYFALARALEREPRSPILFAQAEHLQVNILAGYDRAIALRSGIIAGRNGQLAVGLFVGLLLQLATIAVVWLRLIGPAERRVREALREVCGQRAELLALFEQNPDSIAVYDRNGLLTSANAARVALLNIPEAELRGRHFISFIAPADHAAAYAAFGRALRGETVVDDTQFRTPSGELLDIAFRLSPNTVNGVISGVIAVSRDMTQLRRAQALNEQMSQRLAALYAIASARNSHWQQQVSDALTLAASQLGCEWGFVSETVDGGVSLLSFVGEQPVRFAVTPTSPGESIAQLIVADDEIYEIDDLRETPWRETTVARQAGWRSMLAVKLRIDGTAFGLFGLGSAQERRGTLRPADRDFLLIVAELLGTIVNRGRLDAKLGSLAYFDPLTGLANRAQLREKLNELIVAGTQQRCPFAVHFVDLDRFKEVNDAFGHAAGDEILRAAANRFVACVRSTDTVARLGGDEFVILQVTSSGRPGAQELADRIARAIADPFTLEGISYSLGCSIGISLFPDDALDAQLLLEHADEAMYRAKQSRGSRPVVFAA